MQNRDLPSRSPCRPRMDRKATTERYGLDGTGQCCARRARFVDGLSAASWTPQGSYAPAQCPVWDIRKAVRTLDPGQDGLL